MLEASPRPSPHLPLGGGNGMANRKLTIEDYFWARVQKTDTCWLWTGTIDKGGYGLRYLEGPNGPMHHQAHRVSWELHVGQIPPGILVCHHCDVRNCVRPDHLFLGTNLDNAQDKMRKGRGRWVMPAKDNRGEGNAASKLTASLVRQIRSDDRARTSRAFRRELAQSIGVSENCIRDVISGRRWSHVK